jgi:hypothetical protein
MGYQVVFDASRNGSQLAIYLLIPVFALIPGMIGWALKDSADPKESLKGKFFLLISAVGFCFSLVFLAGNSNEYFKAKRALETGDYAVVEGTVRNFVPMPRGGHSTESFDIGQVSFRYGSGWGSIVFNSEWNRGFIHDGVRLRIAYQNGDILRIETASK